MIRKAKKKDIKNISKLWLKYIEEDYPDNNPRVDWFIDIVNSNIGLSNYYLLVAEVDNEIVGFIDGMFIKDPSTGREGVLINHFYVLPSYRFKEVGERLQRELYLISNSYKLDFKKIVSSVNKMQFWLMKNYKFDSAILEA